MLSDQGLQLAKSADLLVIQHAPNEVSPLTAEMHGRLHTFSHGFSVMDPIVSGCNSPAVPITKAITTRPAHGPFNQDALATLKSRPQEAGQCRLIRRGCLMHQGLEQAAIP